MLNQIRLTCYFITLTITDSKVQKLLKYSMFKAIEYLRDRSQEVEVEEARAILVLGPEE